MRSATVQLWKLVLVLTIWDRETPGAGFSNMWSFVAHAVWDHSALKAGFGFNDLGS